MMLSYLLLGLTSEHHLLAAGGFQLEPWEGGTQGDTKAALPSIEIEGSFESEYCTWWAVVKGRCFRRTIPTDLQIS